MDDLNNLSEVQRGEFAGQDFHFVKPLTLSSAKIEAIWNRVQNLPYIFNDLNRGDRNAFINMFLREDTVAFELGDYGLMYFTEVNPPVNANGHIIFWDRTFKDRVDVARHILTKIFDDFGVHRVSSLIPVFNRAAVLFSKKVGFHVEGITREIIPSLGKWHDAVMLSLLRRDLDGRNSSGAVQSGDVLRVVASEPEHGAEPAGSGQLLQ